MTKTAIMLVGMAAVLGGGIACFGMFSSSTDPHEPPASTKSCEGLQGQAKIDCERQLAK